MPVAFLLSALSRAALPVRTPYMMCRYVPSQSRIVQQNRVFSGDFETYFFTVKDVEFLDLLDLVKPFFGGID